jgi:small-conductance mechanosensitive channel
MNFIFKNIGPAWSMVLIFGGAILFGLVLHAVLFFILRKIAGRTTTALDNLLLSRVRNSFLLLLPLLSISLSVSIFRHAIKSEALPDIHLFLHILYIIAFAWMFLGLILYLQDYVLRRYQLDAEDNLQARRIYTQVTIIRKLAHVIVVLLALVLVLMQFETLRYIGTGILASAGLAGIIIGFAAQKTIGNLLAGMQIALTQPIRFDDVVVVEGEWGRIEEVTLTYVVVRIWDLRRLILPISYFIEKPFQNWTRQSSDILGSVYVYVDYSVPVDELRNRLQQIVKGSPNWDGKVCRLQVTDATDRVVQVRALMSASDSGAAWELRCEVRERLIEFVKLRYPECLPRLRAELFPSKRKGFQMTEAPDKGQKSEGADLG